MKTKSNFKNGIRIGISVLLVLIFSVSLTLFVLASLAKNAVSQQAVTQSLEEIHYTEGIREDIRSSFATLCLTSGIPEELCASFLEQEVENDSLIQPILQMYTDETLTLPTAQWNEALCRRIEEYALPLRESGELNLSDEEFEALKATFPETAGYFISKISSSIRLSGLFSVLGSAVGLVERLVPYVLAGTLLFLSFSALLLFLIWKKNSLYFAYAGTLSSGILFLVPALLYRAGEYGARLGIQPEYLKQFLNAILNRFFDGALTMGIFLCIAGLLFGAAALFLTLKKTKVFNKTPYHTKKDFAP